MFYVFVVDEIHKLKQCGLASRRTLIESCLVGHSASPRLLLSLPASLDAKVCIAYYKHKTWFKVYNFFVFEAKFCHGISSDVAATTQRSHENDKSNRCITFSFICSPFLVWEIANFIPACAVNRHSDAKSFLCFRSRFFLFSGSHLLRGNPPVNMSSFHCLKASHAILASKKLSAKIMQEGKKWNR